jgi:hypothetical protein
LNDAEFNNLYFTNSIAHPHWHPHSRSGESGNFWAEVFSLPGLGEYWITGNPPAQLGNPAVRLFLLNIAFPHRPRIGRIDPDALARMENLEQSGKDTDCVRFHTSGNIDRGANCGIQFER